MVQAMGIHRFRIDRVLHRALDGLILTCEVTNFVEEGNEIDIKLGQTPLFTTMQLKGVEFCQLSQKLASHAARAKAYEQKRKLLEETTSASALTFKQTVMRKYGRVQYRSSRLYCISKKKYHERVRVIFLICCLFI